MRGGNTAVPTHIEPCQSSPVVPQSTEMGQMQIQRSRTYGNPIIRKFHVKLKSKGATGDKPTRHSCNEATYNATS